ncbi:SAVED domain-containing protein [Streptosporangium saharense]|uniref:SAVED domain-containing protein n=1 Tax=Streptosporangium saharense TaxID=1706840 RepID=UPI003677F867
MDGTALVAVGGVTAGGFGVEAAKSFLTDAPAGRWWLVLAFVVGLAFVALGLWLRSRTRRQVRVGIVVTATDARRGLARAQQLDQQAETFSRSVCTVTLKTSIELPGDGVWDRQLVDALADETLSATTMAERLTPDAVQINLIPTMPLHVAFWFGARLGYTHAREVVVHAIRQADGTPAYFPATSLRAIDSSSEPLIGDRLEVIDGGDPTKVAIALDLQGRGDQFFDQVLVTCHQHGIGYLLRLRSASSRLAENNATFTGVVEQTCRAWREAPLPTGARTGQHAIFLSGPVAIAVALGARLASPEHGRWTAFTFDAASNTYEPFPAPVSV